MAETFSFEDAVQAPKAGPATFSFDEAMGTPQRELPSGVKSSTAGGGRGSAADPRRTDAPAPVAPKDAGRAARISAMDEVTDPANPNYMPVTDNAVRALQTDARGGMDAQRTRYPGRVLDKDIPAATAGSMARDTASGVLQVGPTFVKSLGDVTRLATGDTFGKGISDFAERGNKAIQEVVGSERGGLQRRRFEQDHADEGMNAADLIAGNPGALSDQILPTVGSMGLPLAAAGVAGKIATGTRAAQIAAAIDAETVIARANAVREATVLGTTIAQNAGDTFSTVRDAGSTRPEAYGAAVVTAPFTYVAGKLTGGGAEGQVSRSMAGQLAVNGAKATAKAVGREAGQEAGEQVGQTLGETYGKGEPLDVSKASKDIAVSATLGGLVGGAAHIATDGVQGIKDAALAREAQIKRLRDAGETGVADLLQTKHDKQTAIESVDSELAAMPGNPEFQTAYRNMRTAGLKPAEAAGRSAVTVTFQGLAAQTGIPTKAADAALQKASTLPIDQVPGFFAKFTNALAARGLVQPFDGIDTLTGDLETARDEAIDAVMGAAYSQGDVRKSMDDVLALEKNSAPGADFIKDQPVDSTNISTEPVQINDQNQGIDPGVPRETPAPDAVPAGAAAGNAGQPLGSQPVLETGSPEPGPEALNGVLRDTNPQAGTAAQTEAVPGQAAEVAAVDEAGQSAAGDAAGGRALQTDGLNEPAPHAERAQAAIETVAPQQLGRNNTPLTEGGKPFKSKLAADTARKGQTTMRTVRVEGGYVLTEKSEAQLAAQEKAARRLSNPQTSPAGEAIPAHAFIASEGGLSPFERADMGIEGNVNIGNRKLFAGTGKGLTIERATEKLVEDGYLPEGAGHDQARSLIKRSLTNPQYTPEGTEFMAEKESTQREADYHAEQEAIALLQEAEDNDLADAADAFEAAALGLPESVTQSEMALDDAMRVAGFTDEEIQHATANQPGSPQAGSNTDPSTAQAAAGQGPRADSQRDGTPQGDSPGRSPQVEQKAAPAQTDAAPAAITFALRDSGSLAVKGNPQAIRDKLKGITKIAPMEGGMMVGKTQAQRAIDILSDKPVEAPAARPLSVGITPATAEAVTVKDGKVFIGSNEAVNFDSGDAVTVKPGATDAQIVQALKDAGALSRRQKVFGLQDAAQNQSAAQENSDKPAPDALKSAPDTEAKPERNEALIELRKRESVLKALIKCMGG